MITTNSPAEWDQRQLFNERLHQLFMNADSCSVADDYDNWFDSLRAVWRMINAFLNEKERGEIERLTTTARRWAKAGNNRFMSLDHELVQDNLHNLHMELYNLAHNYKLLLPTADKSTAISRRLAGKK